jgi:GTPase SAR1 family protein
MASSSKTSPKILVVGDEQTGKTTLCYNLMEECGNSFLLRPQSYIPTQGVEVKKVVDDTLIVKLWDCAGNPDLRGRFFEDYFERADGVVVVGNPGKWVDEVREVAGRIPAVYATSNTPPNEIVKMWRDEV